MKKVPLGSAVINDELTITYQEQILQALSVPKNPQAGCDAAEMRTVTPIIDKVEAATGDYVMLEDAEHKEVAERMEKCKFTINHKALETMVDDIVNAPDTEVKAVG